MLVKNGNELVNYAKAKGLVLPAFNTTNLETTLAIVDGLNEAGYPGIVQIAPTNAKLSNYHYIFEMVNRATTGKKQPIMLHLDHGRTFEDVKCAVEAGFQSVMIDAADKSFEENIRIVRQVVDYCKMFNVIVEAELGAIGGKEDDHVNEVDSLTNASNVAEFVERTGCDMLAVSVGNVHGLDLEPSINFKLLEDIHAVSPVPLVIHGGSGIDSSDLEKLNEFGVVKLNIASDIRKEYISTVGKAYLEDNNEHNLIRLMIESVVNMKEVVIAKVKEVNGGITNDEF